VNQGYSIYPQVFGRSDIACVLEALSDEGLERTRAGARRALTVPAVQRLAADSRLLDIARPFVGPAPIPFRATLFDKSPSANWLVAWHQDTALPLCDKFDDAEWGPWSTKAGVMHAHAPAWALETIVALRVSLDDSTATNGPLKVLPDSHRDGVFSDEQIAQLSRQKRSVDCVAPLGAVVAMRPLIVHASSKSTDHRPRRVLHIEYAATLSLGNQIELADG
jgi:ectoine hydroxylase-related dioxygenase (phytanoyl-CoA dioxygenase family)